MAGLPEDILYLICDELLRRCDLGTLFLCCATSKILAVPALKSLYQSQVLSNIASGGTEEASSLAEQELIVRKWSILWRTIILSALNKTILPYSRYLRMLDLDNFKDLLEDDRFRTSIQNHFFSGDLSQFNITFEASTRASRRVKRLDVTKVVERVGDLLIPASPLLETLSGPISATSLVRWIPSLSNLRFLKVWDGQALGDDLTPNLLSVHCPKLESLEFYLWVADDCDQKLGAIFSGLPKNTLKSFTAYSLNLGPETSLSINNHAGSLKHLEIQLGNNEGLENLGYLNSCVSLETLHLSDSLRTVSLELLHKDVFLDVVKWLTDCRKLKSLHLSGFLSGAAIATPVMIEESIKLEQLTLEGYAQKDQQAFHRALVHQKTLQRLTLESEPLEFRDDIEILVDSLCQLEQLNSLKLIGVSAMFSDTHIIALADSLKHLEDIYVGGLQLTDAILSSLSTLTKLQSLAFYGITTFTMEGLLEFVSNLGPGNKNMTLAIDNADPDVGLSEDEQMYVRAHMMEKIEGRLEYTLLRDPDVSDFEGESD